jgi:uncharacterized protein (TIGR00251 family)
MAKWPEWAGVGEQGTLRLRLHAQPGAKRTAVGTEHAGRLRIALHAPPVDGKANEELVRHLAKRFGRKRSQVRITAGETSREKTVQIECDEDGARAIVDELLKSVRRE